MSRSPHGRGARALIGAPIRGIAGASALALLAAGCRAPAREVASRPSGLHQEKSGPFVLESEIADPKIRAAAVETLARASEVLEALYGARPERELTIRLYPSETDRWVAEGVDPTARDYQPLPASASRASLRASVAFPRIEVVERRDALPDLLLCDSTRIALAHEAAHLWTFATIPGEENIPESIHEGIAEWVADQVQTRWEASMGIDERDSADPVRAKEIDAFEGYFKLPRRPNETEYCVYPLEFEKGPYGRWVTSAAFQRESGAELGALRLTHPIPTIAELLDTTPRASKSPQLWTAAAWFQVSALTSLSENPTNFVRWVRAMARGEDPKKTYEDIFGIEEYRQWIEMCAHQLGGAQRLWSVGRDVSQLRPSSAFGVSALLAPTPGSATWLFDSGDWDCERFEADADVQILGGGSPELWLGFGFDDGRNGVRAVIPTSGKATVEGVVGGVPNYGFDASLSAGAVRSDRPFHVRVRRDNDEVTFFVGFAPVTVRMPRGFDAKTGRIGVGARGGAFTVRDLRITVLPPRSK